MERVFRTAVEELGFFQTAEPLPYYSNQMVEEAKMILCRLRVLLCGQRGVLVTHLSLFLDQQEEEIRRQESLIRIDLDPFLESPHLIEEKRLRLRQIGEYLRQLQNECLLQIEERLHRTEEERLRQTRVQCTADKVSPLSYLLIGKLHFYHFKLCIRLDFTL